MTIMEAYMKRYVGIKWIGRAICRDRGNSLMWFKGQDTIHTYDRSEDHDL